MTTYTKHITDRRPAVLKRAKLLTETTILPEEALIERLQAPPAASRLSRSCVRLHRKLTKRFPLLQQDPVAALIASMLEITHARGANTLHAVIDLDDCWGFGAAVRDIAHEVASSVSRVITTRDESPGLEMICAEAMRGEVSINAPYSERVLEYIISPDRLENASGKLAELRLEADEISTLDARRLVVFGFDHVFGSCVSRLKPILELPRSADGKIHVLVLPELHSPTTDSWPSRDQVGNDDLRKGGEQIPEAAKESEGAAINADQASAFKNPGKLNLVGGSDQPISETISGDGSARLNCDFVGETEVSVVREEDQ